MRYFVGVFLAAIISHSIALVAIAQDSRAERMKEKIKKAVKVTPKVFIPVDKKATLEIKVNRELLDGNIAVEIKGLPKGISSNIENGILKDPEEKKPDTNLPFSLKAAPDFELDEFHKAKVLVSLNNVTVPMEFEVVVQNYHLETGGWMVMVISVCSVLLLVSFCLVRVLTLPPTEEETLKGPLEIDTGDTQEAD